MWLCCIQGLVVLWFVYKPQCSNELFDQGHRENKYRNLVLLLRVSFQNMVYKGTKFTSWEMAERVLLVGFPINDRDHLLCNLTVISCCLNAKAGGAELIPAGEKLCVLQGNHEQAFTPGKTFTQSICSQGHGWAESLPALSRDKTPGESAVLENELQHGNNVPEPSDKVMLTL